MNMRIQQRWFNWRSVLCMLLFSISTEAYSTPAPTDPLNSPQWTAMHQRFLNGETAVFDDKVQILAPTSAEDSMNVPITFKADALDDVQEIVVFADMNPIPLVLKFRPGEIKPNLSFRMKLQQGSPIRVAAKTPDNVWHVGSVWVNAAGGGCTLPSAGTSSGDWTTTLGQVSARLWERNGDSNRLRVKVMHPMDTGLASGIPKFYIENLQLKAADGQRVLAGLELHEPVSENPMLSLDVGNNTGFMLDGRDNNGNEIEALIQQ